MNQNKISNTHIHASIAVLVRAARLMNENAFIGGGVLRDLVLGVPPLDIRDIDIFIPSCDHAIEARISEVFSMFHDGAGLRKVDTRRSDEYGDIVRGGLMYEFTLAQGPFTSLTVQLVLCSDRPTIAAHLEQANLGVNQVAHDGERLHFGDDFLRDMASQTITIRDVGETGERAQKKVADLLTRPHFAGWRVVHAVNLSSIAA